MKILVLLILVILVIAGIVLAVQSNTAETNPAVSNIPEGFRKQNIPVYVCDKNPIVHEDAICWELGQ